MIKIQLIYFVIQKSKRLFHVRITKKLRTGKKRFENVISKTLLSLYKYHKKCLP